MLRATFLALLLSAAPAVAQDLMIHDPYAITAVPGAPTGGAYMLIHNHGSTPDRLTGARSPVAEHVMLHTHEEEDGVMRMRPAEDGLEVPAGGVLLLGRGGNHIMFMGITDPFEDGDTIPLTLIFEQAGEIEVEVPVDLSRATEDPSAEAQAGDHEDH
jgi:copper(I)-binding protein